MTNLRKGIRTRAPPSLLPLSHSLPSLSLPILSFSLPLSPSPSLSLPPTPVFFLSLPPPFSLPLSEELPIDIPALPHLQAVRTTHTEPNSGRGNHSRTSRISSGKIMYEPATEPDGAHRRWLREAPGHRCSCLRGLVCCLRHGQPPTPPQQGARDDWRRTPDQPDTHHAGKQTLLRGAEREEEPLATTKKRTTTGKCTGTDVLLLLLLLLCRAAFHCRIIAHWRSGQEELVRS